MTTLRLYLHYEKSDFTHKLALTTDELTNKNGNVLLSVCQVCAVCFIFQDFVHTYNKKCNQALNPEHLMLRLGQGGSSRTLDKNTPLKDFVSDGMDIFVEDEVRELKCGRSGCGKSFFEKDNHEKACQYHPGPPLFHEGYKGWKCCDRKSTDFDEFMGFTGCALGRHEVQIPRKAPSAPSPSPQPQNVTKVSINDNVEVYKNTDDTKTYSTPAPKSSSPPVPAPQAPVEIPDPDDAVIPLGTKCLHQGCDATYHETFDRSSTCTHHPGVPIFHEGSKGWSCCNKRTGIFEDFLLLPGCFEGRHKFVRNPKEVSNQVSVRHDFYQSGDRVNVTFYAKNANKASSSVTFLPNKFSVELTLVDGAVYKREFNTSQEINPQQSKYEVLSTKVEVTLRKASPGFWSSLE